MLITVRAINREVGDACFNIRPFRYMGKCYRPEGQSFEPSGQGFELSTYCAQTKPCSNIRYTYITVLVILPTAHRYRVGAGEDPIAYIGSRCLNYLFSIMGLWFRPCTQSDNLWGNLAVIHMYNPIQQTKYIHRWKRASSTTIPYLLFVF